MLNLIRKENDIYVFEEIVILRDVNAFFRYEKVHHHVNSTSLKIESFINQKKVLNNRLPNEFSSSSFIEKAKEFIKSSELGRKAVKAGLALAISTGLSVSANAIENQNLNTQQIEYKHNVAKEYLIKNISSNLSEAMKRAKEFNKDTGIQDHENKESLDFENNIKSYVRVINIDIPVIAEYDLRKNEIDVYVSEKALSELSSIAQAEEMLKMVRNLSMHEYQHALTVGQSRPPLEKYAVEAQQKFGEKINTEILPKSIIERNKNYFNESFKNQINLLKNEIENSNNNNHKKEEFFKMINSFEKSYEAKLKSLNTFSLAGKREITLDTTLPNEYLSTTMSDKDFKQLSKELDLNEKEQFVLSRESALIMHVMPTELSKQGYEIQDIKALTSLAIQSQENYKENTAILEDEKRFFHTTLTEEFKDINSAYFKWLNKEMEKAIEKEKLSHYANEKINANTQKENQSKSFIDTIEKDTKLYLEVELVKGYIDNRADIKEIIKNEEDLNLATEMVKDHKISNINKKSMESYKELARNVLEEVNKNPKLQFTTVMDEAVNLSPNLFEKQLENTKTIQNEI